MNWYVICTKPKWEKKVANQLNELGITSYCPLLAETRQWSDRKKIIHLPLFTSYVFVQIEESERARVFRASGTVRYLFWLGKPAIVRDEEIKQIQNWLSKTDTHEVVLTKWQKGDKVILDSGPFAEQPAVVQDVKQNHYILVLESLGCVLKIKTK